MTRGGYVRMCSAHRWCWELDKLSLCWAVLGPADIHCCLPGNTDLIKEISLPPRCEPHLWLPGAFSPCHGSCISGQSVPGARRVSRSSAAGHSMVPHGSLGSLKESSALWAGRGWAACALLLPCRVKRRNGRNPTWTVPASTAPQCAPSARLAWARKGRGGERKRGVGHCLYSALCSLHCPLQLLQPGSGTGPVPGSVCGE